MHALGSTVSIKEISCFPFDVTERRSLILSLCYMVFIFEIVKLLGCYSSILMAHIEKINERFKYLSKTISMRFFLLFRGDDGA